MDADKVKIEAANLGGNGQRALALRPKQAALMLGIGRRLLWQLTNQRQIPHARLGRAVVYPTAALERWLTERAKKSCGRA